MDKQILIQFGGFEFWCKWGQFYINSIAILDFFKIVKDCFRANYFEIWIALIDGNYIKKSYLIK